MGKGRKRHKEEGPILGIEAQGGNAEIASYVVHVSQVMAASSTPSLPSSLGEGGSELFSKTTRTNYHKRSVTQGRLPGSISWKAEAQKRLTEMNSRCHQAVFSWEAPGSASLCSRDFLHPWLKMQETLPPFS